MPKTNSIIIATGNPNKLKEILAIAPDNLQITSQSIDLDEIQTLDLQAIVSHKLKQAYKEIKRPVIVEDVSAELESLGGLPGPFVKFFVQKMGSGALYDLSLAGKSTAVNIRCLAGYFDGSTMLFGEGVVHATVVTPRGENGFGFDASVVPNGETCTVAEMSAEEKNQISHRAQAMRSLFTEITSSLQKAS
jgi:non-canonical purine NTP pyrophosphatase (RdgB/HAM1 family)